MARIGIALILATIALTATVTAFATVRTVQTTAAVDVTVWKHNRTDAIYLSTRPADGRWTTHNTPVTLTQRPNSPWLQGSAIRVDVPVTVTVEGEAVSGTPWCDDRPSWRTAARNLLVDATGFYSGDPIVSGGHRDHVLPWSVVCALVTTAAEARDAYNDLDNLVPTMAAYNLAKGDELAHEWLRQWYTLDAEAYAANACEYARRYDRAAVRYGHEASRAEQEALQKACAGN